MSIMLHLYEEMFRKKSDSFLSSTFCGLWLLFLEVLSIVVFVCIRCLSVCVTGLFVSRAVQR